MNVILISKKYYNPCKFPIIILLILFYTKNYLTATETSSKFNYNLSITISSTTESQSSLSQSELQESENSTMTFNNSQKNASLTSAMSTLLMLNGTQPLYTTPSPQNWTCDCYDESNLVSLVMLNSIFNYGR